MNGELHDDKMEQARVPSRPVPSNVIQNGQDDAPRPGGRRLGFKLDPREIGWAPYVMIGGGLGLGLFVLAVAMFLKHAW